MGEIRNAILVRELEHTTKFEMYFKDAKCEDVARVHEAEDKYRTVQQCTFFESTKREELFELSHY
jgi:hypothetical protein